MKEDDPTTNQSTPPSTTKVGTQTLKTDAEGSTNSVKQESGTYNLRCNTCGRFLATNLETEKEAEKVIDQHIEGKSCESFKTDLVKPQEPIEPENKQLEAWKKLANPILAQSIMNISDEARKELLKEFDQAVNEGEN